MDPYSSESELYNIQNAFHGGQYQQVIDFDTTSLSDENKPAARSLQLRARIQLNEAETVIGETQGQTEPELVAIRALAEATLGQTDSAVSTIENLAATHSNHPDVQVLGGVVLQLAGKLDEALALLSQHENNLEAIAVIVTIYLQQNRTDLALKEINAARRWAQDSLLVNLAEAWVDLRVGGDKYQSAFYVFEELAQAPATSSVKSLVSQAIAEIHLGRVDEASAALKQALEKDLASSAAIANQFVLAVITGQAQDGNALKDKLQQADPKHQLLLDIAKKSSMFDDAAAKYKSRLTV